MIPSVDDLGRQLLGASRQRGIRLSVAESCTGGRVASALTATAGASETFVSGIVSYCDEVKSRVLGVEAGLIETHTAVSPIVATEMARCVSRLMKADLGLSTTGYLGPTGGHDGTPPGLVYIALSYQGQEVCHRLELQETRLSNAEEATREALRLALEFVQALPPLAEPTPLSLGRDK